MIGQIYPNLLQLNPFSKKAPLLFLDFLILIYF